MRCQPGIFTLIFNLLGRQTVPVRAVAFDNEIGRFDKIVNQEPTNLGLFDVRYAHAFQQCADSNLNGCRGMDVCSARRPGASARTIVRRGSNGRFPFVYAATPLAFERYVSLLERVILPVYCSLMSVLARARTKVSSTLPLECRWNRLELFSALLARTLHSLTWGHGDSPSGNVIALAGAEFSVGAESCLESSSAYGTGSFYASFRRLHATSDRAEPRSVLGVWRYIKRGSANLAMKSDHKKTSCRHQLVRLSRACNCQQEAQKTITLCVPPDNRYNTLDMSSVAQMCGFGNVHGRMQVMPS